MAIGEPNQTQLFPYEEEKTFPKEQEEKEKKRRYFSYSSSAISTASDSDSCSNEPEIKRFMMLPDNKWYK